MLKTNLRRATACGVVASVLGMALIGLAQAPGDSSSQVTIQREALRVIDPSSYQFALYLEPVRSVAIAPQDAGVVQSVLVKPGRKVNAQTEVIRLKEDRPKLVHQQALAQRKVAELELKNAEASGNKAQLALLKAKLDLANVELLLAEQNLENTILRAPFAGEIFRVDAVAEQVVQAAQPLVELGETTKLKVEIPIDRKAWPEGSAIELRIEGTTASGTIEKVFPLAERFAAVRDLAESVASAVVIIDNAQNKFKVGQAVHCPLAPRQPVTELSTSVVSNTSVGQRKVQVLRQNYVRDVTVELLGQIGVDRVFVSGAFLPSDEIVLNASQPLPDGTFVRPLSSVRATQQQRPSATAEKKPAATTQPKAPLKTGF